MYVLFKIYIGTMTKKINRNEKINYKTLPFPHKYFRKYQQGNNDKATKKINKSVSTTACHNIKK
jgi:hypothetical protein